MQVLVTNDDGFESVGIEVLVRACIELGWDPTVVVPAAQQSGTSRSRKEGHRIEYDVASIDGVRAYKVDGTPAECVLFATCAPEMPKFDACLSGVNAGENLGADLGVSGTFGAASEGWSRGLRSCALSRQYGGPIGSDPAEWDWDRTTDMAVAALRWLFQRDGWTLANANLPNSGSTDPQFCSRSSEAYFSYEWSSELGGVVTGVATEITSANSGTDIDLLRIGVLGISIAEPSTALFSAELHNQRTGVAR